MYSEHEEEKYILEAVADMPTGQFIDVGAYDGIQYSNTRALVERGWSGIMIEPGLTAFQKLLTNYQYNDKVELIHGALDPCDGFSLLPFWENPRTYSTTTEGNSKRFAGYQEFSRRFWVPALKWPSLFTWKTDVLSIDTEGTSADVLCAYNFAQQGCPRVICVEHDDRIDTCWSAVEKWGYQEVYRNIVNVIYVKQR